jgi:hypothetical protein
MLHTSIMTGRRAALAAALVLGLGGAAQADIIYANNAGGDAFNVNLGGGAANRRGEAVDSTNWYYNSVGGNATIGINGTPSWAQHDGNGSVVFQTTGSDSKADIEYLLNATHTPPDGVFVPGAALGQLKDLTAFSYQWYRDSSSTNSGVQAPSLRLQITNGVEGVGNVSGYLVFEPTYSQFVGNLPTNTWITSDLFANPNLTLWSNGNLPNQNNYTTTLSTWMSTSADPTSLGNFYVVGISSGVGSGWAGAFLGGVDNITFGFNGQNTTYNFEVSPAVPEPASIVSVVTACGMGLAAAAQRRRRAR